MEAKDTVLTTKQLSEINSAMPSEAKYGEVFEFIAEKQAEISFKAGQESEKAHWVREIESQVKAAYEGGIKAGYDQQQAELRSDKLVAELDRRYPPVIDEKK